MSQAAERRFFSRANIRAESGRYIAGQAVPFDVTADIGPFLERVKQGAFSRVIAQRQNVAMLVNHSDSLLLGRILNNTLKLEENSRGLQFRCDVARTTAGDDALALVKRGDISEMSFGFSVPAGGDDWTTAVDAQGRRRDLRTITECNPLYDVSCVTFGAYGASTSVQADGVQKRDGECDCTCEECQNGDCENCSDEDCSDENCRGHERSAHRRRVPIELLFPAGAPRTAPVEMRSRITRAVEISDREWIERARMRARVAMLECL